jgi:hypothetical protein
LTGTHDLRALSAQARNIAGVRKTEVRPGDWLVVRTRNSMYSLCSLGGGEFMVSGGWFDKEGVSPAKVSINGCTWGGRAIHSEMLAAPGLCLEFGNQVTTTRIQQVRLLRAAQSAA